MTCPKLAVVTCDIMRLEFETVIGDADIGLKVLEYALHDTPARMPGRIMKVVREAEREGAERIALGYGLCSKGTVGVQAEGGLVIPRCHDCIAMLIGSPERYKEIFYKYPAFYLSAGWMRNEADPLTAVERKYIPRLGEKKAMRAMSLELANYKYVCYVDNGLGDRRAIKERALENCRVFNKEYLEIPAGLEYFERLIRGPHPREHFLTLGPGEPLSDEGFY